MTVAWISEFPIEWMADLPEPLRGLPRQHPATWMPVLLEEFRRNRGLKLHVITLRKNVAADLTFERDGVTFHVLKTRPGFRAPSLFWHDTLRIRPLLRRLKPDLVHAWGTERGAALVASRLGYPYLVTIQGLLTWYRELIPFHTHDKVAAFLERISLNRASVVTTESIFAVRFLRQHFPHLQVKQAEHAPNRVFQELPRRPQRDPVRFLAVGSIGFRKGTDILLRALAQCLDEFPFEMLFVGGPDGPLLEQLKTELPPRLWERVKFKSGLRPPEVAAELAQATIAVLPTRADTSPNAVKEAVVAGVPVVATRIGGVPDYVFDGENGIVCEPESIPAFADALRRAVHHPLFGQGRVDEGAMARARAHLSPEKMGENFLAAYQVVLAMKRRQPCL